MKRRHHTGTVIVAALVAVVVALALIGAMLQATLRVQRQLHAERNLRQCELLLQAGVERAAFGLHHEADFRQETWKLEPDSVVGLGAASVTIEASSIADQSAWQVEVVAEYPLGDVRSVRRSCTVQITEQSPAAKTSLTQE